MVAILPRARRRKRAQRTVASARTRLDGVRSDIRELGALGQPVIARERDGVSSALLENRRQLSRVNAAGPEPAVAPFELDRWVLWTPDPDAPMSELRVGSLRESGDGEVLGVPCVVPLVSGRSIVIVSRTDRQREVGRALWQGLVTRLAALNAGRSEMVLLDPTGTSFSTGHRLFSSVVTGIDIPIELDRRRRGVAGEGAGWVVAGDVPVGFSQRDAALLLAMVRSQTTETTFVLHVDEDAYRSAIGELDLGAESARWLIDTSDTVLADREISLPVVWDGAPPAGLLDLVSDRLTSR